MTVTDPSALDLKKKIAWLFPTPVIIQQWDNSDRLNKDLQQQILVQESKSKGLQASNAGGWQSSADLLTWGTDATNELKKRIDLLLYSTLLETSSDKTLRPRARFRIDCWANVNRNGDYNAVHNHPNSLWSGVYYVTSGEPDPNVPHAGKLELIDPREAAGFVQINHSIFSEKGFLNNAPGTMIMFPSWLKHMVHPHAGASPRISIAFNALPVL